MNVENSKFLSKIFIFNTEKRKIEKTTVEIKKNFLGRMIDVISERNGLFFL